MIEFIAGKWVYICPEGKKHVFYDEDRAIERMEQDYGQDDDEWVEAQDGDEYE